MLSNIRLLLRSDGGKIYKSIFATCLCDLANFGGIFFIVGLLYLLLNPYLGGTRAETWVLWTVSLATVVYMVFCYFAAKPSYNANFVATYNNSTAGRLKLAEHIRSLSLGALGNLNPARVSYSMMKDFTNLENANSHIIPELFSSLIITVVVFLGLCFYNASLALSFFSCVPVALAILALVKSIGIKLSNKQVKASMDASERLSEYINGIATIKTNNMQGARFQALESSLNNLRSSSIKLEVTLMPFALTAMSCVGAGIGIMVMYGQYKLLNNQISVMEFMVLMIIASRSIAPFIAFSLNFMMLQYFSESKRNIEALMQEKPLTGTKKELPEGSDLVLQHVKFGYEPNKLVLDDVNIEIPKGKVVAIVGPSGSGKSTLVKILARFYDPLSGTVLMGDLKEKKLQDLKTFDPEVLMQKYAMVFQDSYLFKGSVYDNITFGNKNISREAVEDVMKRAKVDFTTLDAEVKEAGKNFSGGERQRICIARCMLKDAPIVLLDEITSSLDVYNEYAMQLALQELCLDKTVVIIAHKLKNIMHSDLIIVMDQGKIVAQGSHEKLMAEGGLYKKMFSESL